jgi:DNA repair exonuclease SbcCD ATPase subunit
LIGNKFNTLLSIRLALISSFLGTNTAFLLLDEPFAYFDRQREQKAREVLASLCKFGWQIILVSAKN